MQKINSQHLRIRNTNLPVSATALALEDHAQNSFENTAEASELIPKT